MLMLFPLAHAASRGQQLRVGRTDGQCSVVLTPGRKNLLEFAVHRAPGTLDWKKEGFNRLSAAISHHIPKLPASRTTRSMSISGSENPTIRSLFIKRPPPVTAPKILRYRRAHELSKQPSCHL